MEFPRFVVSTLFVFVSLDSAVSANHCLEGGCHNVLLGKQASIAFSMSGQLRDVCMLLSQATRICPRLVCTCEAAMLIAGQPGSVHKLSACKLHMLCLKLFNHARLPLHTASGQVDKSCRFFSAACLYFLDRLSSRSNGALTGTLQPRKALLCSGA